MNRVLFIIISKNLRNVKSTNVNLQIQINEFNSFNDFITTHTFCNLEEAIICALSMDKDYVVL